ncbi:hypothetical protein [Halorussus pelagicus]|uniref:hypothetical protein n=1 Tax=Halorussus pelagicus TaxID=2505977 RepID=UPI000FFB1DF8|nr:hypothetical protein [Halorussus pelagicus]
MGMRGKEMVILIVCIVAATAFASATLAPTFGVYPTTGVKEDVDDANRAYENSSGEVSDSGSLNPADALGIVGRTLGILGNLDGVLVNLGVPKRAAVFFAYPVYAIIGWTILQIVLRTRL